MTTGMGLVIFGILYLLTAVVGIGLTSWRDVRTLRIRLESEKRALRIRLESEERQAEMAAAATQFNVKFTPEELQYKRATLPPRTRKKKA